MIKQASNLSCLLNLSTNQGVFEIIINPKDAKILVIDNIDSISKEEQLKFSELLEHRKISTFNLPDNCVIIVTAKNINKDTINEEIFSLVARI